VHITERLESHRRWAVVVGACAAAVIGTVAAFGSDTGAQNLPVTVEPISVANGGSTPVATFNRAPAMSDTGAVVVFDAGELVDGSDRRVWVRDRSARTTVPVGEERSAAPGISGNGCIVAYSVSGEQAGRATSSLAVVDRCQASTGVSLPLGVIIDTVPRGAEFSAPALSFDGVTIVWSTGTEIRRFERSAATGTYVLRNTFDAGLVASPEVVTGAQIDVSADGSTVAFVAGPGTSAFAPSPGNVHVWTLAADATIPTIALLSSTALGAPGSMASGSPTLSADGAVLVFDSVSTDLAAVKGPVVAPFLVRVDLVSRTSRVLVENAARPALSDDGHHVAFRRGAAVHVLSSPTDLGDAATTERPVPELQSARPDSSMAMSQFGRWLVVESPVPAAAPGLPDGSLVVAGDLRSSPDDPVIDTTTTTTTTTPPVVTSPPAPAPPPATPRPPTTRRPPTPSRPFPPPAVFETDAVSVEPSVLSFDPTIIDAGRRTGVVRVTNSSSGPMQLSAVELDAGAFTIEADACTGMTLSEGGGCEVTIVFAPTEVGPTASQLSFVSPDGVVSVSLTGTGSAAPTLEAVPAVAAPGQVVTVFGGGFPDGTVVEISRSDVSGSVEAVVDADGGFVHSFVVPGHAPAGPMTVGVAGQPDLHGDVATEALVTNRGPGSSGAAFRDRLASPFGR